MADRMFESNQAEDEVPREVEGHPKQGDPSYEELVDPDLTGEAAPRGERPNVGELGPDTTEPNQTNGVDNATEYNKLEEFGNNR